jgi:UDP-N-acetylglucosamine--N-acetylmuramyl-(pentapeptide) pyrophosphoryl-undecaprenol N-acetylglucosamine transferase
MRALLVASSGGHLSQLHTLAPRISGLDLDRSTWVTFDTPQSRSLLAGRHVVHVPYTAPRDWRNVVGNMPAARRLLSSGEYDRVISTGSAIALSFIPVARRHRVAATYLESAARSHGPSLTGRLLARVPGVELRTQWPGWASGRWRFAGSVLDAYASLPSVTNARPQRVLVTLGTIPYQFRRLVERMLAILPAGVDVTWQTGATDVADLGLPARASIPGAEFDAEVAAADVVVAHAGTGSALAALRHGKCPVLIPRECARGEHVDDHQRQIGEELHARHLGVLCPVGSLSWDQIELAASRRTGPAPAPPPILLGRPAPERMTPSWVPAR